jgi:hypothetical protein
VYFSTELNHQQNIWRVAGAGGAPEQVTQRGSGLLALELPDGINLVYQAHGGDSPLLVSPSHGGSPRELIACVKPTAFDVASSGVFYVGCDPGPEPSLHLKDLKTGYDRVLGTLPQFPLEPVPIVLAVSPDGKTVLYTSIRSPISDLMLIENFK